MIEGRAEKAEELMVAIVICMVVLWGMIGNSGSGVFLALLYLLTCGSAHEKIRNPTLDCCGEVTRIHVEPTCASGFPP
jgi:hypothetical protein